MKKILITSVGSGVGQSVVDSLKLTNKYIVVGCSNDRNVYAYHFCHQFHIVSPVASQGYVDEIVALCQQENIDLVIPGYDHELTLFSEAIDKFHSKGVEVIVSKPDLIKISRDKYDWYNYFKEYGCSVVPTYRVSEFLKNPNKSLLPAIVKPTGGSASQGITIVNTLDDLASVDGNDIIQPYLFPEKTDLNYDKIVTFVKKGKFIQMSEISIQLVFTKESELGGIFISKNTLKSGIPVYLDPIENEEFEYIDEIYKFVDVCKQKKVVGPVNIQGRITSQGLICFEMNMRFTGITGNRALLGFNEVDFLVNNFLGEKVCLGSFAPNKVGVRQVACTTMPKKNIQNKIYTVLGASGFVGSEFVNEALKKKDISRLNLICRDNSFDKYISLFSDDRIQIIKESDRLLPSILANSDYVINFASALAHLPQEEIYEAVRFQYRIATLLLNANPSMIVNISSQSVYNQKENSHKTEKEEVKPYSAYSFQKLIAEEFFQNIQKFCPATQVVSLRLSRVLGANYRGDIAGGFFANIVENILNVKPYAVATPNNNTNLIDVRDVVDAIFFLIGKNEAKELLPAILNLGGENISLRDYCEKAKSTLEAEESYASYGENANVELSSMIDISCINKLGWKPKYSIEETIKKIAANKMNN